MRVGDHAQLGVALAGSGAACCGGRVGGGHADTVPRAPTRSRCARRLIGSLAAVIPVRDDLRALEGYHSPQIDVKVRLNTNESPLPAARRVA